MSQFGPVRPSSMTGNKGTHGPTPQEKGEGGKTGGNLMDPAKELLSVITSDWKIVCFKEQKPEALLVTRDLKFLIN